MKANIDDYKKEIHIMIDKVNDLSRVIRIFGFVKKIFDIEKEEEKEA
mgnify:CR=1 FL=1